MTNEDIALSFAGVGVSDHDLSISSDRLDGGEPVLFFDPEFSISKKNILLITSCHGLQIRHFLSTRAVHQDYNINLILVHRALLHRVDIRINQLVRNLIQHTSCILSNPLAGDYEPMNFKHLPVPPGCRCYNFVPPNNAALWPVVEHFGERGVTEAMDRGESLERICDNFRNGSFDPLFYSRWAAQIARLKEKESLCDIRISEFCERNVKKCKLWFTENHPTFNLIACISSQFEKLLGIPYTTEEECVWIKSDTLGIWNAHPETSYEFDHYGFEYPMRYENCYGGFQWYLDLIKRIAAKRSAHPGFVATDHEASA